MSFSGARMASAMGALSVSLCSLPPQDMTIQKDHLRRRRRRETRDATRKLVVRPLCEVPAPVSHTNAVAEGGEEKEALPLRRRSAEAVLSADGRAIEIRFRQTDRLREVLYREAPKARFKFGRPSLWSKRDYERDRETIAYNEPHRI